MKIKILKDSDLADSYDDEKRGKIIKVKVKEDKDNDLADSYVDEKDKN